MRRILLLPFTAARSSSNSRPKELHLMTSKTLGECLLDLDHGNKHPKLECWALGPPQQKTQMEQPAPC